jgi:hypothetical protein
VSIAFNVLIAVIKVPEGWQPFVSWSAGCFLATAVFGWLLARCAILTARRRSPVALLVVGALGAGLFMLIWRFVQPDRPLSEGAKATTANVPAQSPSYYISIGMQRATAPVVVPPNGTLYYAVITAKQNEMNWGLKTYSISGPKSGTWYPDRTQGQEGITVVRCDIKNTTQRTIVSATLEFNFSGKVDERFPPYTIPINSLDPGATFSFYFDNASTFHLLIISPEKAKGAILAGEIVPVELLVHRELVNPLDMALRGGMMFMPHDALAIKKRSNKGRPKTP